MADPHVDLAVDIAALNNLADRLQTVSNGLDNADNYLDHRGADVGSDRLGDGLHHFATEQSDGISDIRGEIKTVISQLRGAAETYGKNETAQSQAYDGSA